MILGYWHTIVTPPMVFARLLAEIVEEMRAKGIDKPVVVSLAGDVEVEEASEYLFDHKIPAYPYSTEIPVDVPGAKYKWARGRLALTSHGRAALPSIRLFLRCHAERSDHVLGASSAGSNGRRLTLQNLSDRSICASVSSS